MEDQKIKKPKDPKYNKSPEYNKNIMLRKGLKSLAV